MKFEDMKGIALNHRKHRIRKKYLNMVLAREEDEHKHIWIDFLDMERGLHGREWKSWLIWPAHRFQYARIIHEN